MWDLPRPGLEPVSPALAGRFSTTAPPGKPPIFFRQVRLGLLRAFATYNLGKTSEVKTPETTQCTWRIKQKHAWDCHDVARVRVPGLNSRMTCVCMVASEGDLCFLSEHTVGSLAEKCHPV